MIDLTKRWQVVEGDARIVLPMLPEQCARMIWTDPPYGHGNMDGDLQSARVRDGVAGARVRESEPIANDTGADFESIMDSFFAEAARVLDRDCCCCCCMGGGGPNTTFARMAMKIDTAMEFFQAIVWDKTARGPGMGWRFRRDYEFVMVSHRRGGRLSWNESVPAMSNIMRDQPVRERIHPNEKPVSLMRTFILAHTKPGDLVIDPFAGSGGTGVACMETGRRFVGVELDPGYAAIARLRIAAAAETLWTPPEPVLPVPQLFP